MEALESACSQIVTVLSAVSGIEQVPLNPESTVNVTTFGLVYPMRGNLSLAPLGDRMSLHDIAVDIFERSIDISNDIAFMKPFIDTVPAALLAQMTDTGQRFGGSLSTFEQVTYEIVNRKYAGVPYLVCHFMMMNCKILVTTS